MGKSIPHGKQQVQRPWGRQSALSLEEKQKPLWLEQRTKDGVVEFEVRQVSGNSIRQRLRTMVGALIFMPKWGAVGRF